MFLGRCFHLCAVAITDPNFGFMFTHKVIDHIGAAIKADDVQNCANRTKDPLPKSVAIDPAAGFIRMDHSTCLNSLLDGFDRFKCLRASPLHDLVNATFADFHSMQISHGSSGANIAHVLFLAIVHHRRFQTCAKSTLHIQIGRRLCYLTFTTAGTLSSILPHFNHFSLRYWQFGHLVDIHKHHLCLAHFGLATLTDVRFDFNNVIWLSNKWTFILLMTCWRSVFMPFALWWQI